VFIRRLDARYRQQLCHHRSCLSELWAASPQWPGKAKHFDARISGCRRCATSAAPWWASKSSMVRRSARNSSAVIVGVLGLCCPAWLCGLAAGQVRSCGSRVAREMPSGRAVRLVLAGARWCRSERRPAPASRAGSHQHGERQFTARGSAHPVDDRPQPTSACGAAPAEPDVFASHWGCRPRSPPSPLTPCAKSWHRMLVPRSPPALIKLGDFPQKCGLT